VFGGGKAGSRAEHKIRMRYGIANTAPSGNLPRSGLPRPLRRERSKSTPDNQEGADNRTEQSSALLATARQVKIGAKMDRP